MYVKPASSCVVSAIRRTQLKDGTNSGTKLLNYLYLLYFIGFQEIEQDRCVIESHKDIEIDKTAGLGPRCQGERVEDGIRGDQ